MYKYPDNDDDNSNSNFGELIVQSNELQYLLIRSAEIISG